jgi:hypothetical protein
MGIRWRIAVGTVACLFAAIGGCNQGPRYVPVSGVVTLNGKPYADAVVVFMPQATEGNLNPGRGSSSYTDKDGRFSLKTMDGDEGAVAGNHVVQIMSKGDEVVAIDPEVGSPDDLPANVAAKARFDPIPREWTDPGKPFQVPPGGTDQANFDIKTRRGS